MSSWPEGGTAVTKRSPHNRQGGGGLDLDRPNIDTGAGVTAVCRLAPSRGFVADPTPEFYMPIFWHTGLSGVFGENTYGFRVNSQCSSCGFVRVFPKKAKSSREPVWVVQLCHTLFQPGRHSSCTILKHERSCSTVCAHDLGLCLCCKTTDPGQSDHIQQQEHNTYRHSVGPGIDGDWSVSRRFNLTRSHSSSQHRTGRSDDGDGLNL